MGLNLPHKQGFYIAKVRDIVDIPRLSESHTETGGDDYIEPLKMIITAGDIAEDAVKYIKIDTVLPEYLRLELEEQASQYSNMDLYLQNIDPVEAFAETELYIPEGDIECTLSEQQRIYNEYREKELLKMKSSIQFDVNEEGQLVSGVLMNRGKYIIDGFLSSGGFGKVYKAHTTHGKEPVAIKELYVKKYCFRQPFGSQVFVPEIKQNDFARQQRRFNCECDILSKLSNVTEYVPKIIGASFTDNNTVYYVMEYINGSTLWENCKNGKLSQKQAVNIICQVGIALHHAHNLDYLHLDVSPLNVMITDKGHGKLIDFGSNKHYSNVDERITSVGQVAKTMPFASPELLQPVVKQYYMQSDVYSLAATLYSALTQNVPFAHSANNDVEFMAEIKANLLSAKVSDELVEIILKALSLDITDRYPTVLEFLHAIPSNMLDSNIKKEIDSLTPVTGFNTQNHNVTGKEEQDSDYTPGYSYDETGQSE